MNNVKSILVTGATGFIGQHVIKKLLTIKGIRIIATARIAPAVEQANGLSQVHFIPFDIADSTAEHDLFAYFGKPDAMIHLAWGGLSDYKSMVHLDTYWLQHYQFLTNLLANGLTNLTVTGTCLEYGLQSGCLSETLPTLPTTSYGMAKDMLRKALELYLNDKDVSFKWVRLFYMYGRGQNSKSLLAQIETAALRGDTTFNMSGGEQLRDYLPVTDVASIVVRLATYPFIKGIYNCSSGKPISIRALAERFINERNYSLKLNLGYYPYPEYEPLAFWGDNQKLQMLFNS